MIYKSEAYLGHCQKCYIKDDWQEKFKKLGKLLARKTQKPPKSVNIFRAVKRETFIYFILLYILYTFKPLYIFRLKIWLA